jgi:asparagine synthase (glutamine-hydrolysing)
MCGIIAIFGQNAHQWRHRLAPALEKMSHRGPDEQGTYEGDNILLGQTRLSIIDVTGGRQPIFAEDTKKCIICNGEIYNHMTLRSGLSQHHQFRTRSDTEVILHLFEENGEQAVSKLDGMFAFVVYDGRDILVARDPLGIKPLYYGQKDNCLFFASEIKALKGMIDDIQEFPAGYYYSSIQQGFSQYYFMPPIKGWKDDVAEIRQGLHDRLYRAVEKRWMADVPVGCFLSGGLDSSLICAISKRNFQYLDTFSVGFEDESQDLIYAKRVAQFLDTTHHEYIYTRNDVLEALPNIIYHLESFDPALVRSAIPCYFVSRLAREHVKVILTGEGSDEVFAGYHYFKRFDDKQDVHQEAMRILTGLHNMNLQRVDRATMAHSIEARVPFLDIDFVEYAMSINPELKLAGKRKRIEKWLLRQAFADYLPDEIIWRPKMEFAAGCGSEELLTQWAESAISDVEFEQERQNVEDIDISSKEELCYFRIFREFFGSDVNIAAIGRWQGGFSREGSDL